MYRTVFVVRGAGTFPFDMLRYDRCSPYESNDALNLEGREMRNVTLVTYHKYKGQHAVTQARWESFAWHVTNIQKPVKVG